VSQQWRRYNLVGYGNSVYGNVAVIQQVGQYTFFANGLPELTAPVPDVQGVEELVHLSLLFHSNPRRVVALSGGVGGVLHEILKYPVERVDYAELDPLLIQMARRFPTPLTESEPTDPRVHIHTVDGRLLARQMALPRPSPQMRRAEEASRPGEGYDAIVVVPGHTHLWIASPSPGIAALTLEELVARWEQRQSPVRMMSDFHIRLKLDEQRTRWFWDSLALS